MAFAVFLVLSVGYSLVREYVVSDTEMVPLSQIAVDINAGLISSITVEGDSVTAVYADKTEKKSRKETESSLTETLANYRVSQESISAVDIEIKDEGGARFWFLTLAPLLIPVFLLLGIIWFLSRQMRGAGMQAFTFGRSLARLVSPEDTAQRITFSDVAGAKEAKEELTEIVDFLKNPKKFIQIGARIPKGVILMGAPGTGKTLLARAVAGEAGVPFFSISGSEFVEMFVGVGASRVRDLFETAKKTSPAIVFIDEIDAVGRVRGTGVGGGNDEREQTLNQILVEMDGFEPNEKVIVMAASNRPDVLDPALLRPGRFDRRVTIDLPDRKDREEILKVHARKKPLGPDVKLPVIAERTPGFSGADLANLMNEGAILAARENRKELAQFDLVRSIEKVMLGPERRSHVLNKKEKEITAYHEAGHALVASVLPYADPVHKISIISRGRAAGYTLKLPLEDKKMQSRKEFLDDIAVSLGGFVAERMVYDDVTTGAANDLQVLSALARDMVARYGMSENLGPIAFDAAMGRTLFGVGVEGTEQSEEVAAQIDAEVKRIIDAAHKKAESILKKHRKALNAIAKRLVEVETIERDDFEKILIAHGITPKKKEDIEHQPLA
ncbi:cell division protein FtsH [Candidatus Kaiserbacteria bacterium RIFCSPHIGHO2_01_FULL_55_17]|uniref:ATP-dependent zinc metalloprotease FtsH n=1 Tax=Candidatus Kaiserbacteria bacterium RIFCSPHIGHO2_01_FULL_55_17 TaxID=1798484 RepID=A0A1F6D7T8_9BACT|nr:MAG: cell division protein FtsH [Candidatus Kaiserbacteria bacterium RIFCSPHIGHO2_01_FULL_55_17]